MLTRTYIILTITLTVSFQSILFVFGLTMKNGIVWWPVTILFALSAPLWLHPLADWLDFQISLYREARERRRKYEFYRDKVKAGSVPVNDFEDKAKEVIK